MKEHGPFEKLLNDPPPVLQRWAGLLLLAAGVLAIVLIAVVISFGFGGGGDDDLTRLRQASSLNRPHELQISGWLPAGAQPDAEALALLTTVNPVDFAPAADGSLTGRRREPPNGARKTVPTVRASTPEQDSAVDSILASEPLRQQHIALLVQLAQQPGNAGVDVDYARVPAVRRADFSAFIRDLAAQLHQADRTLSVVVPTPVKNGVSWDTGAYDWPEINRRADLIKLSGPQDPSLYHLQVEDALGFLEDKVDLSKVALVVPRASVERSAEGLRTLSLNEALAIASEVEVRAPARITPNVPVTLSRARYSPAAGGSGPAWDDQARAVSFSYAAADGPRTVWLENALSLAFKLDSARRHGLAGVAIADVSADAAATSYWQPLRSFSSSEGLSLVLPNAEMLHPAWEVQGGAGQQDAAGDLIWTPPPQSGTYQVSLVVSDGVIRAARKLVLEVAPAGPP